MKGSSLKAKSVNQPKSKERLILNRNSLTKRKEETRHKPRGITIIDKDFWPLGQERAKL